MKGFIAFFVVALAGVSAKNKCPSEQAQDWSIEALLPHPDCSKFYQCTHGRPVEQSCPEGLQFNTDTLQCDYPENVQCGSSVSSEETPGASSEESSVEDSSVDESGSSEEIKFLPNGCPENPKIHWLLPSRLCRWYYNCLGGRRIRRCCRLGLHFNAERQVCDHPRSAGCSKLWT